MPKQKSHSGAKKRIRRTGSGKYAFKRNSRNHLLQQKSSRQKRLPRTVIADGTENAKIKGMLPYL